MEQLTSEKQSAILDAARKRFAYYGFSKVTMDEIAADIGMGKTSLYYYFPTKASLFGEVIKAESTQFLKGMQSITDQEFSPSEMLRKYTSQRIEHFRNLVNLRVLEFQLDVELRLPLRSLLNDFQEKEIDLLTHILTIGNSLGEFSISNPRRTAEVIIQALWGPRSLLLHKHGNNLDDNTFRVMGQVTSEIAEIILNGITKSK